MLIFRITLVLMQQHIIKLMITCAFSLNVENVTDELYYPHSYGTHQVTVGAPIHATLKIVGRF